MIRSLNCRMIPYIVENYQDEKLVRQGCCYKIPQTEWLMNNRNVFLRVLGLGKIKIKVPAWSCLVRALSVPSLCLLAVSSPGGRASRVSGVSVLRTLLPFRRLYPRDQSPSPKLRLLIPSFFWSEDFNVNSGWLGRKYSDHTQQYDFGLCGVFLLLISLYQSM